MAGQTSTAVTPRWEWRAFGGHFGKAEDAFAALVPSDTLESDELYLLSPAGDNVKIRDGLMDIKVLQEVDPSGLERWTPVMKAAFPLPAPDVERVFESLGVPCPPLTREAYSMDAFLAELVEPTGRIRSVPVHKRRVRYTVQGCMAELSSLVAGERATRTLAIESSDPAAVIAAVRSVGLDGYTNVSYPRGLATLVDDAPRRFATIDVGTNSVKFHIGERGVDGAWRTVLDRAEVTRIGEGLESTGRIGDEPLERTLVAIEAMVHEARSHDVLAVAAVGTAGARMASNSADVVAAVEARAGIPFEVISGEEESRLAYVAVQASLALPGGSLVVFDSGGGSTQFTFGSAGRVDDRFSLNVGAARYTERFGLDGDVSSETVAEALLDIAAELDRIESRPAPDALVGMGGAITNLTAVKLGLETYDPMRVQGAVLELAEIDRQIEMYRTRDAEARRSIIGLQPKRAEVILAGACIVRTVLQLLGQRQLLVSDRGLRHGLLAERFGAT